MTSKPSFSQVYVCEIERERETPEGMRREGEGGKKGGGRGEGALVPPAFFPWAPWGALTFGEAGWASLGSAPVSLAGRGMPCSALRRARDSGGRAFLTSPVGLGLQLCARVDVARQHGHGVTGTQGARKEGPSRRGGAGPGQQEASGGRGGASGPPLLGTRPWTCRLEIPGARALCQ